MGIQGFYIYRYKGKYYVHYSDRNSHPKGLGSGIIKNIPTDPNEYRAWLNRTRTAYAIFDRNLEEQVFTISDASLKACAVPPPRIQDPPGIQGHGDNGQRLPKREVLINARLECVPSGLPDAGNTRFIEWVYTIDLDREVFSVNNGAHFCLDKIPRNDVWIKGVASDVNGLRTVDTEVVPKDCVAHPVLTTTAPNPLLLDAYKSLTTRPIRARATLDLSSEIAHSYLIRLSVWRKFSHKYGKHLPHFLYGWEPQEFVFREFVYAVLCLASGDTDTVRYMPRESLQVVPKEGYRWFKGKDGNPILLPIFMEGCHHPGIEPGISPTDVSIYWFGGVVVYPTVRLNSDDYRNAAIAKAVAFGKESGHRWFDAVLISIEHVVLLRLSPGDVVEHTDAIPLFSIPVHTSMYAEHRPAVKRPPSMFNRASSSSGDPGRTPIDKIAEALQTLSPGFVALIHLFDGAAYSQLKPLAGAKEGIFPTEIMHMILSYTDDKTYQKCAKASRGLRYFCQRNLRIFEDYIISSYQSQMRFTVLNRKTGVVERSHLQEREKVTSWCPIIGATGRLGYLNDVEISFSSLVAQSHHDTPIHFGD